MSVLAKATFAGSVLFTVGTVGYVHYWQKDERKKLGETVARDIIKDHQKAKRLNEYKAQVALSRKLIAERDADLEREAKQQTEKS